MSQPVYMLDDRTSRKMPGGTCPCKSGTGPASAECTHTVSGLDKWTRQILGFYIKFI